MKKINNNNYFDQEKYYLDQVQQTDQNVEDNFKKMKKSLNSLKINTIIITLDKNLFSVIKISIAKKKPLSLTTVKASLQLLGGIIAYRYKQKTTQAQIKLKKLINIISLRGYMCVLASNITNKIANSCSIVISSIATRDIHKGMGISSGLSVLNLWSKN